MSPRTGCFLALACITSMAASSVARADDDYDAPAPVPPIASTAYAARPAPPPPAETHIASPGLVGGGVALSVVGLASIGGGVAVYMNNREGGGFMDFSGIGRVAGVLLMVTGAGSAIGGAAMIGVGAQQVPSSPGRERAVVSVGVGPSGVSVAGRF